MIWPDWVVHPSKANTTLPLSNEASLRTLGAAKGQDPSKHSRSGNHSSFPERDGLEHFFWGVLSSIPFFLGHCGKNANTSKILPCTTPRGNTSWWSPFHHPTHSQSISQWCFGLWCSWLHPPKSKEGDDYHPGKHWLFQISHHRGGSSSEWFFSSVYQAKGYDPSAMGWSLQGWCEAFAWIPLKAPHIDLVWWIFHTSSTPKKNWSTTYPRHLGISSHPSSP